jgi:hypothetical protein
MAGYCKHGVESSGSVNGGEFIDKLNECQILTKDSVS